MSDKKPLEELKILVFEQDQATKQNKDRLFKLAKASNDIETIQKLADEYGFKSAKVLLKNHEEKTIDELFSKMSTESIMRVISNGLSPDTQNKDGMSFLHFAAEQDNRILVKFLIENGANINIQDALGATPLLLAAQENNYETMKLLIDAFADLNLIAKKHGYSPLMASVAKFNSIDAVNLLIDNGAEVNVQDTRGVTPLLLSAQQNFSSIVTILLKNGANPNLIDNYGYNALHIPCEKGHENIVKILLATQVDINHQDNDGDTSLIIAAKNGFKNIVEMLLDKIPELNLQNKNGDTALIMAAYGNHYEVVKLLVEKKAKINTLGKNGTTALDFSLKYKNNSMTDFLIDSGANKIFLKGETLNVMLLTACFKGDEKLIKLFINNGADKNYKGENGNTPLIVASTAGHLNIIKILLENDVNVDLVNNFNCTALWAASYHGHIDIVRLLLENKADPDIKNSESLTALFSVAGQRMDSDIISAMPKMRTINKNDLTIRIARVLLQYGANPNILNKFNSTVLILSARLGDTEMVQLLLDYNARMDIQENTGLTALIAAADSNHHEISELLLKYDANVNQTSSNDASTALSCAVENNNLEMVKLLVQNGANLSIESNSTLSKNSFGVYPNDLRHGTPMQLAMEYGFDEIVDFLKKQLANHKSENELPKGQIKLEQNLSIDIFTEHLLFKSKVGEEIFENRYIKIEKNTYEHAEKGTISIFLEYIMKKSKAGDEIKYLIKKFTGSILDIDNSLNPIKLVKLLTNFTDDKPMKYTTHDWDFRDLKKEYVNFEGYLKAVKIQWNSIKDELEQLSPNLYQKVYNFLWEHDDTKALGWSSVKGLNEWCDNDNDPFTYQINHATFGEIKDAFKNQIEIRKEQDKLEDIFIQERKKLGRDFNVELVKLKGKTFYTDVEKFKMAISRVFKMIILYSKDKDGNIVHPNIKVEAIEYEHSRYLDIYIVHIDSFTSSSMKDMKKETIDGDFKEIKKNLQNLCDWSIQNSYEDDSYQINYLKSELVNEDENLQMKPEGFTHILRFYNK